MPVWLNSLLDHLPLPAVLLRNTNLSGETLAVQRVNTAFTNRYGYHTQDIPDAATLVKHIFPIPEEQTTFLLWLRAGFEHPPAGPDEENTLNVTLAEKSGEQFSIQLSRCVQDHNQLLFFSQGQIGPKNQFQMAQVAQAMPLGALILDKDHRVVWANEAFEKITSRTLADVLGKTPAEFNADSPPAEAHSLEIMANVLATRSFRGELLRHRKNGEAYWLDLHVGELRDESGQISGYVGVFSDVTERRNATEEMRKLATITQRTTDGVLILDEEGKILWMNEAFEHDSGYTLEELKGKIPLQVFSLNSLDQTAEVISRKTDRKKCSYQMQMAIRRKDGMERWWDVSGAPVFDDEGKFLCFLSISRDITERKKIQEDLFQARKMDALGQLVAGVAHDYNNIITIIGLNTHLLVESCEVTNPSAVEPLKEILTAADKARDLTKQLLTFARKSPLHKQHLDINEVLGDMRPLIKKMLNIDTALSLSLKPGLPPVMANRQQVETALLNLASNARDAMPRGGILLIETRLTQESGPGGTPRYDYVQVSVTDTGTGMDDATKARLFEPFFTTKHQGKGTGLGASMVYGLMSQLGGFVRVESTPGEGATIHLFFPPAEPDNA